MKKVILTMCSLLAAVAVVAQTDTVAHVKNVYVMHNSGGSQLLLGVGGYQVALTPRAKPQSRVLVTFGTGALELGYSLLTTPSYAGYSESQRNFLDQRVGKSIHFGIRPVNVRIRLGKSDRFYLNTGVHLMCDNYTFSNDITLGYANSRIVPEAIGGGYKKTKLTTAAFGIPVQFSFQPVNKLSISALVYGDLVFSSHTKYKKPIQKSHLSGVRIFQTGIGASVSYNTWFGVYFKYGLTEFFRDSSSPHTHPLTAGIYFGF